MVYQLSGVRAAELLVASFYSLRVHYDGPVTIFATKDCWELAQRIAQDNRLGAGLKSMMLMPHELPDQKRIHCLSKVYPYLDTPYDQTLFLDADTIVNHPVTPFFQPGINVTAFGSGRITEGNRMSTSLWHELCALKKFGPHLRKLVQDAAAANLPWINTGAWSFPRGDPALWEIHLLCTIVCNTCRTSDEVGLNAIAWRLPNLRFLPDRCHRSSIYWEGEWREPIVLHNNSRNWIRRTLGRASLKHHLARAMDDNVAGIREWLGQGHWYVERFWRDILAERAGQRHPAAV